MRQTAARAALVIGCASFVFASLPGHGEHEASESCTATTSVSPTSNLEARALLQRAVIKETRLETVITDDVENNQVPTNPAASFTSALSNTYLGGYAPSPNVFSTLNDAMVAALSNSGAAGITQESATRYTLRSDATPRTSPYGETSWLKLSRTTSSTQPTTTTTTTVPAALASQFDGPLANTYLAGYAPSPNVFPTLQTAMEAALLNEFAGGITRESDTRYTLRSDPTRRSSTSGEVSWVKKPPTTQTTTVRTTTPWTIVNPSATVCASLQIQQFDVSDCGAVPVGGSCQVRCPAGYEGEPVQFFCFRGLAVRGAPPAAARAPLCRRAGAPAFQDGERLPLSPGDPTKCLRCASSWSQCEVVRADSLGPDNAGPQCTRFTVDLTSQRLRTSSGQCLDIYQGPAFGLWGCDSQYSAFGVAPQQPWKPQQLCPLNGARGPACVTRVGLSDPLGIRPTAAALPALRAAAAGDGAGFRRRALALQQCKARLDGVLPQPFEDWLRRQHPGLRLALFSTFPAHPGQVQLLRQVLESVGEQNFTALNMSSFAVAVSYLNRWKTPADSAKVPFYGAYDGAYYVAKDREQHIRETRAGQHCGISSNECNNLRTCCGEPDTWNFTWPRDPMPSVTQHVQWWIRKTRERGARLWGNPLSNAPWIFGVYLWPSPEQECDWVQRKLLDGEAMEGSWYLYDSSYHLRVCRGGPWHPNALPGIALYGGVCGRMAELEWRKRSCMGMISTQKGEPGHCAGLSWTSTTGNFIKLAVVSGTSQAQPGTCLACSAAWTACGTAPVGDARCTEFIYEESAQRIRAPWGQCLDVYGGPTMGLWGCSGSLNQRPAVSTTDGTTVLVMQRGGTVRLQLASGGSLPGTITRWAIEGLHEVSCLKTACHFPSVMGLRSSATDMAEARHKEAALASVDAYNNYDKQGLWPIAHDEARLAASMAQSLKDAGAASTAELEGLLSWALRRNPSVYDAWLLAADVSANLTAVPGNGELRDRLAWRQWFNQLSLLQPSAEGAAGAALRARAEAFAAKHLLAPKLKAHWRRFPQLLEQVTSRLCSVLSTETLSKLGDGGAACLKLLDAAAGRGWDDLREGLRSTADPEPDTGAANNAGNMATPEFLEHYMVLVRLVRSGTADAEVISAVEALLGQLSVGYIDRRSETFFAEHGRVLLRGPYAMLLQVAGALLPRSRREQLLQDTAALLAAPHLHADRMWSTKRQRSETFLQWVGRHVARVHQLERGQGQPVEEVSSISDNFDGISAEDGPNQEVMDQLRLDRDAEMELGAAFWEESQEERQQSDYDVTTLLRSLLRLRVTSDDSPVAPLPDTPALLEASQHQDPTTYPVPDNWFASADPQELLGMCADELVQREPAEYWR